MNELSLRYANALYSLAREKNCVLKWKDDLHLIHNLLLDNKEYLTILSSEFLSFLEREKLAKKVFSQFDNEILNLLILIIKNHRVNYLMSILTTFNSLCNEYLNILEGFVYSSSALSKQQINELEEAFGKMKKVKVELSNRIDISLLGGVKIVLKDQVYDGSIKAKLNDLKAKLIKGGNNNGN